MALSNGLFIRFKPLEEKETREKIKNMTIFSHKDFYSKSELIINYKKKKKYHYSSGYRNIFSYELFFMIPNMLKEKNSEETFIKLFLKKYNPITEKMLWCGEIEIINNLPFARVVIFTRMLLQKKVEEFEKYNRDYYWNPLKKKLTSKKDVNAVLLHQKGEIKKDINGHPLKIKRYVRKTEERIFSYRGRTGFNRMIDFMKGILSDLYEVLSFSKKTHRSYIPKRQIKENYTVCTCFRIRSINSIIDEINARIGYMFESLKYAFSDDEVWTNKFYTFLHKLNKVAHTSTLEIKGNVYYLSYHSSNEHFRDYLIALRENIKNIILNFEKFWQKHIENHWKMVPN